MEENNQALTAQLEKLQEGVQSTISKVVSSATDYLQHDDRQLQDLVALSALDADDGKRSEAKVAELTEVLSDLTGEEIECRLNRIFLQRLAEKGAATIQEQSELQAQELEQDLKSLHIEIPYVAGMSASQDFKAPLLRALAEQQNAKHHQARNVLEDVSGSNPVWYCIVRLTAPDQQLHDHPHRGKRDVCESARSFPVIQRDRFSVSSGVQCSRTKVCNSSRRG